MNGAWKMKKCKLKKIATILTAVLLAVSIAQPVMCAQDEEKFNNVNAQDYSRCSQIIRSYMIDNGNGFLVGRAYSDSIKIDTYGYNLKKTGNTRNIKCELPKFGGFFRDSAGNYYICSGKDNDNSSDTAEVFRVTKYDSSFNKTGSVSVKGMNTYEIFRAATLRMAEKNGVLYVRSGHTMYDDGDGLHHQACFTLQIDTESMELIDGHWDVANIGSGYVSHSFDQYIMIDDSDNVVAMDLGDAYPRALVMGRYYTKAGREKLIGNKWYVYENVHVMDIYGTIGNNYTGVAAGGLEYSDKKYLAAFSSIEQDGSQSSSGNKNVYIGVVSKNDIKEAEVKKITDYEPGSKLNASAPSLTKVNDDLFLLMWNETSQKEMNYVWIDGEGNMLTDIQTSEFLVTDCKCAVKDETVYWFIDNGEKFKIVSIKKGEEPKVAGNSEESSAPTYEGEVAEWGSVPSVILPEGAEYASSEDNFAPVVLPDRKIKKLRLDFSTVSMSGIPADDLRLCVIKGSKLTTLKQVESFELSDVSAAKAKINKKTGCLTVTPKRDCSVTYKMADGGQYTVKYTVQTPKANKALKKLTPSYARETLNIKKLFGIVINGGKLEITNPDKNSSTVSDNKLILRRKDGDVVKLTYTYLDKKYKMTIKIKSDESGKKDKK